MKNRVFVTGATGVIGRRVVRQLVDAGYRVTALVRSETKAEEVKRAGAVPCTVDLFNQVALTRAFGDHDTVANLATNIPTGFASLNPRAWRQNDRLRRDASVAIARAAEVAGVGRLIQESITFPYVASAAGWITEDEKRTYFPQNETVRAAEAAAESATEQGLEAVVLRFAMFMAPESAHMQMLKTIAQKGLFGLVGQLDDYISFLHADDAAAAVVAALSIPSGTYNVAEADPATRAEHRKALAGAVKKTNLRTVPLMAVKLGGAAVESIARSHRISSVALQSLSSWAPRINCVETWEQLGAGPEQ